MLIVPAPTPARQIATALVSSTGEGYLPVNPAPAGAESEWVEKMRWSRRAVAVAVCAAVLTALAAPSTSTAAPNEDGADARAVREQAREVAAQVSALTAQYQRREAAAAQAAAELSAAYAQVTEAEMAERDAVTALGRARARQTARVRALYVEGHIGPALSMLAADSPSDALWRATVGRRIGAGVVREAGEQVGLTRRLESRARGQTRAATRASAQLRDALEEFRAQARAAALTAERARTRLSTLSARARRLAEAERAAAALAAAQAAATTSRAQVSALDVPPAYESAYRAAAGRCAGLRWTLLAALGQVESGHGRSNGPSVAGALGPMQFMPATFEQYGVDGDGDGVRDVWSPADAIPSAAAYLCASGLDATVAGVRAALFAYNRADWYVDLVLSTEQAIIVAYADR